MADGTLSKADEQLRRELARTSICEIDALLRMLDRSIEAHDFANLWRGAYIRMRALSSVILSVADGDAIRRTDEMVDVVFGPAHDKEASHG